MRALELHAVLHNAMARQPSFTPRQAGLSVSPTEALHPDPSTMHTPLPEADKATQYEDPNRREFNEWIRASMCSITASVGALLMRAEVIALMSEYKAVAAVHIARQDKISTRLKRYWAPNPIHKAGDLSRACPPQHRYTLDGAMALYLGWDLCSLLV